jgi:RNA polymerase sigma-70 factor (ECF subfamily)
MLSPTSECAPPSGLDHWLIAARAGSREALGRMLQALESYLLLVADVLLARAGLADLLRGKVEAADLVQETFLEAHRDFAAFRGRTPASLRAWLRRVLVNNVSSAVQKWARAGRARVELPLDLYARQEQTGREHGLAANTLSPADRVAVREEAQHLHRACARLPQRYRRVIELRHHEKLSFAEVGRALGTSAEAARKLWVRARQRLRRALGRLPG